MNIEAAKITLHMVASVDGFIAKKVNSVGWFETTCAYEKGMEWEGLPFFDGSGRENNLHLLDAVAYKNGLVELHYKIDKT